MVRILGINRKIFEDMTPQTCPFCGNKQELLRLPITSDLSRDGKRYYKKVPVDFCIAGLVKELNAAGIETKSSCCGHGKIGGFVLLLDGTEIKIRQRQLSAAEAVQIMSKTENF